MARAWQRWLSPRPLQRTSNNSQTSFPHLNGAALYEPICKPDGLWYLRETHYIDNPLVRAGVTGPLLHIHALQDEYFKVEQGVLGAVRDGVEHAITEDDGVLHIPPGARHRFWCHKSSTEDLVFTAWVDPCTDVDHILDVNSLRNASGYQNDCHKAGMKPSIFQLILFTEQASTFLCPPFLNWMPVWLLSRVHSKIAWFAEKVLGYKKSYPEYTRTSF